MKYFILRIIKLYQFVSQGFLPKCRFYPSCSQYTYEAIENYGIFPGIWMGFKRIIKCHPFNPGGYDPVPNKK